MSNEKTVSPRGWHSRGYLPHFDGGEIPIFVTWRLEGSVAPGLIESWQAEFNSLQGIDPAARLRRRIEAHLDEGHGPRLLADRRVAAIVEEALLFFDGDRYRMHGWVVMPTHVHTLFTPMAGVSISRILHTWRSGTSHRIGKCLGIRGRIWQRDYFDRCIRDERHFWNVLAYIENNPVKAQLSRRAQDFPFSSARFVAGGPPALPATASLHS